MLRKILVIFVSAFTMASELSLIAITHPSCPVCKAWHNEVSPYYELEANKSALPKLKEYDISDQNTRAWVQRNIKGVTGLPTFVIMSDNKVKQKFDGYRDYQDFFINLHKAVIRELKEQQLAELQKPKQEIKS